MTFAEVVFELSQREHPICKATREGNTRVVYRFVDTGDLTDRHRGHLTIHAGEREAVDLVRDLRARGDAVEILHQAPAVTSAILDVPTATDEPIAAIARLPRLLAREGLEGALDPLIAAGGRLRGRVVVPRKLDAQEPIRAFQAIQKQAGFDEARVLRTGDLDAAIHVEGARRCLAPDQEDILAVAAAMGYYTAPKEATLSVIARRLGRSVSPVHKRLKAAEEALIAMHVGAEAPETRVRARPAPPIDAQTAPYELVLRVRRAELGPAPLLGGTPGARAHLQALSHTKNASAWILLTLAPRALQDKLTQDLAARADVGSSRVIGQDALHVAHAITARERGAFHFPWWEDVWGDDAHLRAVTFEGAEACVHILLVRPHTPPRLDARLAETALIAGWDGVETVTARALGARTPPEPPGPLTPRQVEVLRVAHALGYYRTPRACTLERVASTLGVSANAIHKNLVLAESKIIAAYLAASL